MTRSPKALVTGAAAGLGLALTRQLLASGWHVVAVDRNAEALQQMQAAGGDSLKTVVADLSDIAALDKLGSMLSGYGPYERVIMSAGLNATGRFETISVDRHDELIAVNLTAPMALIAALLRDHAIGGGGCLVLVSSLSRYVGYPGAASYAATKAGLAIFARSLRRPLARRKVGVLVVCPGPLDTAHASQHAPLSGDASRRMKPEDAAERILAAARRPGWTGLFVGGGVLVPGLGPKLAAFAGMVFPALSTHVMRHLVFKRM